ncbi:MAG TPA: MBL fold metallo-hydrolase [Acidimicrobiia bacterium]|nr:MBL fold metallo-hydrolase [Acidimicrobiia bacterium]
MNLDRHPANLYDADQDFLAACEPQQLIYFLLNVGNADTQLLCLPEDEDGVRHLVVVDVGRVAGGKLPQLIEALKVPQPGLARPLLSDESKVRLLVATHPHEDHVGGIPNFLDQSGSLLFGGGEIWDPAFFHKTGAWFEMMYWLEEHPEVNRLHPTAGARRHIGNVAVTALSPSIRLRNNFDTYGVHVNNASIALQVEFPIKRVFAPKIEEAAIGRQSRVPVTRSLLLGADAQTMSWSHVDVDFPTRRTDHDPEYRLLGLARGTEPLGAAIFKVPHHCSKNGLNLELVTRVNAPLSLISCDTGMASHAFPHQVALEQLREARDAVAKSGNPHAPDWDLGIYTTGDAIEPNGDVLGSIAVQIKPTATAPIVWRLGDTRNAPIPPANLRSAWRRS